MQISVLLIEDDTDFGELVRFGLSRPDARVSFTLHRERTLAAGLEYLSKTRVDAVVVDLGLPDSDGPETVQTLAGVSRNIPFLALSAEDSDSAIWDVICHGAEDHLIKAELKPEALKVAIVNAIARHLERTADLPALQPQAA